MMSTRSLAALCIAVKSAPHIEPVLSSTSASSMPVVSRSMTARAPTFIVSWPKTRMKSVGTVGRGRERDEAEGRVDLELEAR